MPRSSARRSAPFEPMKPKMILFDYGQTLVVEPQFDARRGYGAVYDRTDGGKVSRARFADFADAMFLSLA